MKAEFPSYRVYLAVTLGFAVCGGVLLLAFLHFSTPSDAVPPIASLEVSPAATAPTVPSAERTGEARPSISEPAEPDRPSNAVSPSKIDLNLGEAENKQMRDDVLARIDLTPNLTQANRDKLYNDMERARRMGMVVRIPFSSGKTGLTASDIQSLKEVLETPSLMKLRDDPTAVFVVLGYADTKGDQTKNLPISQKRADSVTEAMRVKCNVANVMHAVAMGGTTLHDSASLEKNRVVEVWAVLP